MSFADRMVHTPRVWTDEELDRIGTPCYRHEVVDAVCEIGGMTFSELVVERNRSVVAARTAALVVLVRELNLTMVEAARALSLDSHTTVLAALRRCEEAFDPEGERSDLLASVRFVMTRTRGLLRERSRPLLDDGVPAGGAA